MRLSESQAILRYLGRSTGMMPADPVAQASFDEAQEALSEAQEQLWQFGWQEEYGTDPKLFVNGQLARSLRALERLFLAHPGDFWLGTEICHVDYLAYAYFDELRAFFGAALGNFDVLALFHTALFPRRCHGLPAYNSALAAPCHNRPADPAHKSAGTNRNNARATDASMSGRQPDPHGSVRCLAQDQPGAGNRG